ncbi:FAD-dependent oxidoreductase domain-containing protein 2-like [Glandiceps talaboti]
MAEHHEYIIIGAGPGGLQMGYFMERANKDYLIIESSNRPGSFFRSQPRHRFLISVNKRFNLFPEHEFNMRHDWNSLLCDDPSLLFTNYSEELFPDAEDLVRYIEDFTFKLKIRVRYNTRIEYIEKKTKEDGDSKLFHLRGKDGTKFTCRVLLMATGAISEKLPTFPGIELAETYAHHDIDKKKYDGKRVAVIGRGNSALEVANHLAGHAAILHIYAGQPPKFAWNTHFVGDIRAINNTVLDMYQLKSLHAYLGAKVERFCKRDDGAIDLCFKDLVLNWTPPGHFRTTVTYDNIIVCTGWNYIDQSIFAPDICPETKKEGKFPVLKTNWEVSNVKDMYYLGTAMQTNDRKAASGFIHGFRYNVRVLFNLLSEEYNQVPFPIIEYPRDLEVVGDKIVSRASIAASIYQVNTFLGDAIIIPEDSSEKIQYFEDLPVDYMLETKRFTKEKHLFIMKLTYGFDDFGRWGKDATAFVHWPDIDNKECQAFLRPIITYYNYGKEVDVAWCMESLLLRFDTKDFPEDNPDKNRGIVKNFLNKCTNLHPGKKWCDSWLVSKEAYNAIFTPLTEEEKSRLPPDYIAMGNCKPYSLELTPKDPEASVMKPKMASEIQ